MKVKTIIKQLRRRLHDIDKARYPEDEELIDYLNAALNSLYAVLISVKDMEMKKEVVITDKTPVPPDFVKFVGKYPVETISNTFRILDGSSSLNAYYFGNGPMIELTTEDLPLKDNYLNPLLQLAAMLARNDDGATLTQDQNLFTQALQFIQGAKS